ncbi:hypothetical protein [Citrobacter pasteurii]
MDKIAAPHRYVMDIPILKFTANCSIKFKAMILKNIKNKESIYREINME